MRELAALFLFSHAFAASTAFAQTNIERIVQIQASNEPERMEILTAMRTISDLRTVVPSADGSVRLAGPEEQVKLAEWVLGELDQAAPGSAPSAVYEYPDPRGDGKVRVFYAPFAKTVRDFQEIVTLVRTITDTRRVFQYNARRAMIARGFDAQMALTEQLMNDLARRATSGQGHQVSGEFTLTGPLVGDGDSAVRIFYAGNQRSDDDLQHLSTLLRTVTGARRMFSQSSLKAIAARGTPEQIELAEWLFDVVDRSAGAAVAQERLVPGTQDVVRVLNVGAQFDEQNARTLAERVRNEAALKGVKLFGHGQVLAVRGTVGQVLEVARITGN